MNLFSILRSRKLVTLWEYQTRGALWRLLPASSGFLVGEDRDHTSRSVTFFCLEEKSGNARWQNVGFKELWWIGIEAVHQNVLFLHEFVRPDFPDHKKIIAVDIGTGKMLWRNDEIQFLFAYEDCLYASRGTYEGSLVVELDLLTGVVSRELGDQPEYVNVLRDTAASKQMNDIEFPTSFAAQNGLGTQFNQKTLRQLPVGKLRGDVEFLEKNLYLIVGYYENTSTNPFEQELEQHLKIIDGESGSVVFRDILAQKGKAPVPDLFFIRNDILFYIKNRNTLRAIKLSPP